MKGRTLLISGASRGIGLAIALRAARDGANIVILAKSTVEDARIPGTIYSAAALIEKAGGRALAIPTDIRFEAQVSAAVSSAVSTFGGIDIVINNASAISLTDTDSTSMKTFDLMHSINVRGTYLLTKCALPYLRQSRFLSSGGTHVLTLAPPLRNVMEEEGKWLAQSCAYSAAKFGMSMMTLGHAGEFRGVGIGVNALWPLTPIQTAAVQNLLGGEEVVRQSRTAEIMSDAAHVILTSDARQVTGQFFIDECVLRSACGMKDDDFDKYSVVTETKQQDLAFDFFV